MKVRELIEKLKQFAPELDVVMSRDPEGNNYSPAGQLILGKVDSRFGDWDQEEGDTPAVCLFPKY